MASGALDGNGIWQYGEDDERDTFSELLNIGQDSVSDAIGADRARLGVLEAAAVLGAVTAGVITAASGWSISVQRGRKKAGVAWIDFICTLTGADITVPADGNIAVNSTIATFEAGWVPASGMYYPASAYQRLAAIAVVDGGIALSGVQGGVTVPTGTTFSIAASYPLA